MGGETRRGASARGLGERRRACPTSGARTTTARREHVMVENPPAGTQRIVPYVIYADGAAAIEFLCRCFGFEELFRFAMPDGRIGHAEIGQGGNRVMLASEFPDIGLVSPRQLPARHGQILCYVDDVDAHYARAVAEGATVAGEPV